MLDRRRIQEFSVLRGPSACQDGARSRRGPPRPEHLPGRHSVAEVAVRRQGPSTCQDSARSQRSLPEGLPGRREARRSRVTERSAHAKRVKPPARGWLQSGSRTKQGESHFFTLAACAGLRRWLSAECGFHIGAILIPRSHAQGDKQRANLPHQAASNLRHEAARFIMQSAWTLTQCLGRQR